MAEMRPAGLTEDGTALRLTDEHGGGHLLPVSEELRALLAEDPAADAPSEASAPSRPAPRPTPSGGLTSTAQRTAGLPAPAPASSADDDQRPVSPREIQSRIRAGASAEQVAEATGASLARVRVFEYPVLAERSWMAQQVQQLEVWVGGPDLYSSTVEDGGPATLGALVSHRLAELGVDPETVRWDAWRPGPGPWTVVVDFPMDGVRSAPIQEQPPARFSFRPGAKHAEPENRWARLLSDTESWNRPADPAAPAAEPFDVEADTRTEPAPDTATRSEAAPEPDEELLDILRARRGQRLGADADALARMLVRDEDTTGRPDLSAAPAAADDADDSGTEDGPQTALAPVHGLHPSDRPDTADAEDGAPAQDPGAQDPSTQEPSEEKPSAQESSEDTAQPDTTDAPRRSTGSRIAEVLITDTTGRSTGAKKGTAARSSTSRRASVPSWDEIVFGRKND